MVLTAGQATETEAKAGGAHELYTYRNNTRNKLTEGIIVIVCHFSKCFHLAQFAG
jgi:hypothetical protein